MGDILILAIFVLMTYLGYKKGFLKTLTGVISIVLSFVIAICLCSQVAAIIEKTPVYDTIYENASKYIKPASDNDAEEVVADKSNYPKSFINEIKKDINGAQENLANTVAQKATDIAVKILSMLLLFIAARIVVWLLLLMFGFVKKLPLIGWFDSLLGALFGFLKGLLVVYLLLAVVTGFTVFNAENTLIREVNRSEFAKVMYNNNVFLDFIHNN